MWQNFCSSYCFEPCFSCQNKACRSGLSLFSWTSSSLWPSNSLHCNQWPVSWHFYKESFLFSFSTSAFQNHGVHWPLGFKGGCKWYQWKQKRRRKIGHYSKGHKLNGNLDLNKSEAQNSSVYLNDKQHHFFWCLACFIQGSKTMSFGIVLPHWAKSGLALF